MVRLRSVDGFGMWATELTDGLDVSVKQIEASRIISRIFGSSN